MSGLDLYLERQKERVNLALGEYLPAAAPPKINDAMRYSLEAGGKRLRPILVIAAAETLGSEDQSIIDVACAVEFIHTYSLIHDDLPAMDNSDLRRGKPTCHCVYGDALAVLAGDGLLTLAFEALANFGSRSGYESRAVAIMAELARAAGAAGMIGGQVLDLDAEGKELSQPEIEKIYAKKTGALLKAAVTCGGLAAGAAKEQLKALEEYAAHAGIAFQIIDDLFDYESTVEELGKPVGADQALSKATYPAILGAAGARQVAEDHYDKALQALNDLHVPVELLKGLAEKMVYRSK